MITQNHEIFVKTKRFEEKTKITFPFKDLVSLDSTIKESGVHCGFKKLYQSKRTVLTDWNDLSRMMNGFQL